MKLKRLIALLPLTVLVLLALPSPAHAFVPILDGVRGMHISFNFPGPTGTITIFAAALFEILIFSQVTSLSFKEAGATVFLANIISALITMILGFSFFYAWLMPLPIIALIAVLWMLRKDKMPRWAAILIITATLFGYFSSVILFFTTLPVTKLIFTSNMVLPLLLGFGLSTGIELVAVRRKIKKPRTYEGVAVANVASLVVFIIMILLFGANPYTNNPWKYFGIVVPGFQRIVEENGDPEEAIEICTQLRSPTPYLVGISDNPLPPEPYVPHLETGLVEYSYTEFSSLPYAEVGLAVLDDVLSMPILDSESRADTEWLRNYIELLGVASEAVREDDQSALVDAFTQWTEWLEDNPDPLLEIIPDESYHNPDVTVSRMLDVSGSELIHPMEIRTLVIAPESIDTGSESENDVEPQPDN